MKSAAGRDESGCHIEFVEVRQEHLTTAPGRPLSFRTNVRNLNCFGVSNPL